MGKLTRRIKKLRQSILALQYLINEERSFDSHLNIICKLKCLTKGFSSEKYFLYNIKKNGFDKYLSDYQRHKTQAINGPYSIVLNDKTLFYKLLSPKGVTPKFFGSIKRGNIYINNIKSNNDELIQLLKNKGSIIIKKNKGGGGKGIYRIEYKDSMFKINNEEVTKEEFFKFMSNLDDYIISEYIQQADYANRIYPGTTNTIRILTMKDPETNEIFIPIAVHKFGSKKTEPADNVWRGGITALVDISTGILKRPALHKHKNKKIEWINSHPDTNEIIEGVVIPNWDNVKKSIVDIANSFDFLNYVGWDLVVTNEGIKIIEGNNYSDVNILQIHKPLLVDERVKKFYKYYGILK